MKNNKMIPDKKAQVTIFIILGLIIMASAGVYLNYRSNIVEDNLEPQIVRTEETPMEFQPIRSYVESCLREKGVEALEKLGERGGYIDPLQKGLSVGPEPTESDLVEFSPGSSLKIPYWFHLSSSNLCSNNCEFEVIPENKLYLRRKTGEVSIESQLDEYINANIRSCLDDFKPFLDQGFSIKEIGDTQATTVITQDDVQFYLNYPIEAERNSKAKIEHYYITVDLDLDKIYRQAVLLTNLEAEFHFLERDVLNLISAFSGLDEEKLPPMSAITFDFDVLRWIKSEVKEKIKSMLVDYIHLLRVYGSLNYRIYDSGGDNLREALYNRGMVIPSNESYSGLNVDFIYLSWWEPYFYLNCNGELCVPQESITTPIIPTIRINRYNFNYDLSFPTLVEINDPTALNNKGYTFRFFLESNIRNNEPFSPEFNLIELGDSQVETMLCDYNKRNSGNITINVFDSETDESLDGVQITYTCGGETCIIGTTEDGTLKDRFPVCLGGMITFIKDGYLQTAKLLSTELDQDLTTDNVYLYKFKDIEFDLKKKKVNKETRLRYPRGTIRGWFFNSAPLPLDDNEEALITLTRKGSPGDAEHFAFAEFRGSETTHGNISLVPGLYEVSINLLLDENITIPEDEICYPAGFLGLGEECEDIPEINISAPFPSGGLKFDYEFTEEDLQKDKVTFYAVNPDIAGIEESQRVIEDLEEISKIEEYSARYNSSLRPRFG